MTGVLIPNRTYHVVYRRFNGRVNDELVGLYIGTSDRGPMFSLRPKAGTTELLHEQVESAEETTAPIMLPRRHRVAA